MNKKIIAMFAVDEEYGIGREWWIPWRSDLENFAKETKSVIDETKQNALIMWRRTFEAFPPKMRPLPGRKTILLTSMDVETLPQGVLRASSLQSAIDLAQKDESIETIFVAWGGWVFDEADKTWLLDEVFFTYIPWKHNCDTFLHPDMSKYHPYFACMVQAWEFEYPFIKYKKI